MSDKNLLRLRNRAVSPHSVRVDGNYTSPRTWGVYKVDTFKEGRRGSGFHFGNHPVRQRELEREHGKADLVLLFTSRTDAQELKYLLVNNLV
jgi:hypothetical protein